MNGRLVIVDYNLADERGHHLAVANSLVGAANRLGLETVLVAHRSLDSRAISGRATVRPVFRTSLYEAMKTHKTHGAQFDIAPEIVDGMEEIAGEGTLDRADVLFHSGDGHICRALDVLLERLSARGAVVHLATPYDPNVMPGGLQPGGCDRAIWRLASRDEVDRTLFLYAETAPLAAFYSRAYGAQWLHLPMPAPDWTEGALRGWVEQDFRITFLGAAREEKGFLNLPDIIRAIQDRQDDAFRVSFRIQASAPIAGMSEEVSATLARLRAMAGVTVLEASLSARDYAEEMSAADAILMPYDRRKYAVRGSGVAVEALSLGKILIATSGAFIEGVAPPGLAVFADSPEGWAEGLLGLIKARRSADDQDGIARAAAQFRRRRSGESYIRTLFARKAVAAAVGARGPNLGAAPTFNMASLGGQSRR